MSNQRLIFGIKRRMPWQAALIIAALVVPFGLILLGVTGDFLVDWLWFSEVGYLDVFWTVVIANAVVFVISPAAALATSGAIGLLFLRRLPPARWIAPVLAAVAVVAAILVPWGIRNEQALGKFIPLRDLFDHSYAEWASPDAKDVAIHYAESYCLVRLLDSADNRERQWHISGGARRPKLLGDDDDGDHRHPGDAHDA